MANIVYLMGISLMVLRNDELARIQSAFNCRKTYHLYPQKSLKNPIL